MQGASAGSLVRHSTVTGVLQVVRLEAHRRLDSACWLSRGRTDGGSGGASHGLDWSFARIGRQSVLRALLDLEVVGSRQDD